MEKQVSALTNKYARRRLLKRSLALLCCVMLLFTMNTLKRNADTLERIPMCRQAEHVHSEACYDASGALICGLDEHVHTDACYQERPDAEAVEAMVAQEDVWFDGEDDADVEAVFEDADAEVEEVEAELDVDDEADEGVFDADEGEPVADDMENAVLLDAPKYLSEIIEGAQVEIALADVADIGLVEGDEPADLLWIERDGEDYLIGAKQDFDVAELAVVTADDIVIINLVNGVAQAEPTEEVEELNEVASPEEAEPVEAEEVTENAVTEDEELAAGITEDVEAEEVTEEEEEAEETEEVEESEEAEVAEEVTEEEAEPEESEEAEETEKTEEAEETEEEPDAEQAEETEEVEDEAEAAPAYAATIDLSEVEAYPLSLRALMQAARPAEEPVAEDTIIEEETQEDPAEEADAEAVENAEPEAAEQPEEAAWEIEYDNELLNIEAAEGDYWVTPVQSFESTMIAVSDGSRYELTLIHCDIPSEEAAEDATEETEEPQAAEESATVYPAQGFEARTRFVKVSVTAPEGAFPEGTQMNVVDVDDADTLSDIEQTVGEDFVEVKRVHAVDISFWHDGAEIEPLAPISVVMKVDEIEAQQDAVVVHVDDAGETEIVESQSDAPAGETELTVEMQAAEAPAEALAEPEAEQPGEAVAFEAETFSVYAVVVTETLETRYIDASGESWNISVGYGQDAGIPSGATLSVREVVGAESEDYLARTEDALKGRETVTLARFFDISILDAEGNEVQPAEPVEVRAVLAGETEDDVRAVHFADDGLELVDARREDEAVSFDAEGFSVWGVVYTVDFHYTVNGQSFDCSIPGGDCASLRALLPILNVAADDPETEEDELEAFMAAIESVEFSDPGLVRVCPVGAETTVGTLREANGIESEYSAALTDEDRAAIDARALTAPDWALFSLKPFTTEETLTIAMNNGDRFAVAVTDAQIATRVLAADGQTYKITLTFGPEAGIPLDAELKVEEIGEGSIEWEMYCNQAKQAADIELDTPLDFVRFFDIEIQKEGRKIEPEGTVSVSIALADAPDTAEEDALKIIHFEENGPVVMESRREAGAETAEMAGVSFETDSFSVYGVITVPTAQQDPSVNNLDGQAFVISHDSRYVTTAITPIENNNNTNGFGKTGSASGAARWYFERPAGSSGNTYYIYTMVDGQKKYMNLTKNNNEQNRANASLSDTPQTFTVTKDGNDYRLSTQSNGTTYYLDEHNGNSGNAFAGWYDQTDNGKLTLFPNQPVMQNDGEYMTLVKFGGKYYIVNNNCSLTEVNYDEATRTVEVDDPMLWKIQKNNPNGHIYFNSTEAGFDDRQIASDWYRRYLDPSSGTGYLEETNKNGAGHVDIDAGTVHTAHGVTYYEHHITNRTNVENSTTVSIDNTSTDDSMLYNIYHGDRNGNNYLGVVANPDGTLRLAGQQSSSNAAVFVFATPTKVKEVDWKKHTVDHIDISINGTANVSIPLAYGKYYGSTAGDQEAPILTISDNIKIELSKDQMVDQNQLLIKAEDMKRATISAARADNGKELDDAFYITGYSGNVANGNSNDQVRIEGSFLVADLRGKDYENVDEWRYNNYSLGYRDSVKEARKNNIVEYTVTVVKPLTYYLIYPGLGQLYDAEGKPLIITVDVAFSASFNYWDENNECPALVNPDGGPYSQTGYSTAEWKSGGIDPSRMSGMDFVLGGNADDQNSPLTALEITKVIMDENGNRIELKAPIQNYFDIYEKKNATNDQKNGVAGLHVVDNLNHPTWQADSRDETIRDGYTYWRTKHVTVDDTGSAITFDFNATDAMYYITERHDEESLPETVTDKDGNEYIYVKTYMETEYVRRGDQYDNKTEHPKPIHVTEDFTRDSGSYASIPEVAGKFTNLRGEQKKEGFLEFFVYNCYSKLYPVQIKKVDSTNNSVTLSGAEFDLYGPYDAERSLDTDDATSGRKFTKVNTNAIEVGNDGIGDLGKLQSGIYYLYETKAPDGFNLLTEPVKIIVDSKKEGTTGGPVGYVQTFNGQQTSLSSNGGVTSSTTEGITTYTLTVENTPGARLPATGGPGVAVYYALGSLLVLAAAALLIARRKQEL